MRHALGLSWSLFTALAVLAVLPQPAAPGDEPAPPKADLPPPADSAVDFDRHVRPLLSQRCWQCHGAEKQESGLRLDWRGGAVQGGDNGPALVPGRSADSALVLRVAGADPDGERMPPEGDPLGPREIGLLRAWIDQGAAWPGPDVPPARQLDHWSFQPVRRPALPAVHRASWPRTGLDYFVLARLEVEGLAPQPEADRHTLIRRLALDLTGLPPSPEQVQAFAADPLPDAYERLVDRLLADPGYGERWARIWLDLARYADSKGYGSDPLRTIWGYRDWVIDAFNRNLPYDQFTIEQLAGDLLPGATSDQVLATAFHRNTMANDEGGTDDEEFRVAAVKDRVDTTFQVWMGLTAGCAKCHSHKFDPLTIREYYQLFAFFNQTADADRGDEEPRLAAATPLQRPEIESLRARAAELARQAEQHSPELAADQAAWERSALAAGQHWTALPLRAARSAHGTQLTIAPDGTLLASAGPDADTYLLEADTDLDGLTAIRLQALPDERLPRGGPGLAADGNFVLSEVRLSAGPRSAQPLSGRRLRIENPGAQRILSLAEVQVLRHGENLAPRATASQSSTDYDGPAQLAVDGNTNGDYQQRSVTHTRIEDHPWWELDLGASGEVHQVVIWNRTDNNLHGRLAGARVQLLDDAGQVVWQAALDQPPLPSVDLNVSGPRLVALHAASADHEQPDWPVAKALDGDESAKSGWAIGPLVGQPHQAVFATVRPVHHAGGTRLSLALVQAYGHQAKLGRLQLSVTTAQPPPAELPAAVAAALRSPPQDRSPKQSDQLARYYRTVAPRLEELRAELAQVTGQIAAAEKLAASTPVFRELPPDQHRPTHVLLKSNFLTPGERVAPGVPSAFAPLPDGPANRLALARWLVDPRNPLTARVAVNRFWAQLFGRGLVETEEDFGTQGLPPSHPEALDWLASEFQHRHWDLKALLRTIVLSATYRQASTTSGEAVRRDPYNRLLGRGPRGRLEAEMVRDQALALSGLLHRRLGGPSVYPPQPDGLWRAAFNGERTWATSTGGDRYRRGLYTYWRRTVPYPSLATFDAPSREVCALRRSATNTPLQALVTLNDPVFVEAAQALARRLVREGGSTPRQRVEFGLRLALGRPARAEQIAPLEALYAAERGHFAARPDQALQVASVPLGPLPPDQEPAELAAWTIVSNVLLNLDGVLTKR